MLGSRDAMNIITDESLSHNRPTDVYTDFLIAYKH